MRYTKLLGRIIKAAENLKIEGVNKKFPGATWVQIRMWIDWLKDDTDYSKRELEKIETILTKYLEV